MTKITTKKQSDDLTDETKNDQTTQAEDAVSEHIVLTGALGIAEVEEMHQKLKEVLDAGVDIILDTEDLSRVDAAGVQLLYAFVKEAQKRSIGLTWASVSDVLLETASTLGLSEGLALKVTHA